MWFDSFFFGVEHAVALRGICLDIAKENNTYKCIAMVAFVWAPWYSNTVELCAKSHARTGHVLPIYLSLFAHHCSSLLGIAHRIVSI
jgi:hypothetical protein